MQNLTLPQLNLFQLRYRVVLLAGLFWGVVFSLLPGLTQAQTVNGYLFASQNRTYTPLGPGATRLPTLEADEATVLNIPLGFVFVASGRLYTHVKLSSNGWLAAAVSNQAYPNNPTPASYSLLYGGVGDMMVAPLWADLKPVDSGILTFGDAPSRIKRPRMAVD